MNAGPPVEGVHLKTGVIGDDRLANTLPESAGFQAGVLGVGRTAFLHLGEIGKFALGMQLDPGAENGPDLLNLVGIAGRNPELHAKDATAWSCSSNRRLMPISPTRNMSSSWARV